MTIILLRITAMLVCFIATMLGLIFVLHGIQMNIDFIIILACAICAVGGIVGMILLARGN